MLQKKAELGVVRIRKINSFWQIILAISFHNNFQFLLTVPSIDGPANKKTYHLLQTTYPIVKKKEISLRSLNKRLWKKKLDKKPVQRLCYQGWRPFEHSEKKTYCITSWKWEKWSEVFKIIIWARICGHRFHKCKSRSCMSSVSSSEQDCLARRSDDRIHHHWINVWEHDVLQQNRLQLATLWGRTGNVLPPL